MKKDAVFFFLVGCLVAVCGGVSYGVYWGYMRFIHSSNQVAVEVSSEKGVKKKRK
jgi:hypothetical protein